MSAEDFAVQLMWLLIFVAIFIGSLCVLDVLFAPRRRRPGYRMPIDFKDHQRLLALAKQYASECGECAGTRVKPDDEPCDECADIWRVIDKAEGRA